MPMSSSFTESLRHAIETEDSEALVHLLEPRVADGTASANEALLCGALLLMPPLADYEAAANVFRRLLTGARAFEAAAWDAYRFAVLMPGGDHSFEQVLRSSARSPVAAHMLSLVAAARDDLPLALLENRRSRAFRLFPFNVVEALKRESALEASARTSLWQSACDLIVSRSAESDPAVCTVEGALQRKWDNLIVGTRLTSQLWGMYSVAFGDRK
jgi:hypothetical protein